MTEQERREIEREWYRNGVEHGFCFASWVDLPEIGSRVSPCVDWIGLGETVDSEDDACDYFLMLCAEGEMNGRQYSPFEFIAADLNNLDQEYQEEGLSEDCWEAFEDGIREGFMESWEERSKGYYK